jgi:hypothetical protein
MRHVSLYTEIKEENSFPMTKYSDGRYKCLSVWTLYELRKERILNTHEILNIYG